jgi:hypothetical protein
MGLALPDSWLKGPRQRGRETRSSSSSSSSSVNLTWRLDVGALKQLVQDSTQPERRQGPAVLQSDDCPPFRGLSWRMQLSATSYRDYYTTTSSTFELRLLPVNAPNNSFHKGSFAVTVAGWEQVEKDKLLRVGPGFSWVMSSNPFGVGVMNGGWDEAKWVAQGLPASGCVTLTLKVF